jgi:hypothetical protein
MATKVMVVTMSARDASAIIHIQKIPYRWNKDI